MLSFQTASSGLVVSAVNTGGELATVTVALLTAVPLP